MSSSSLVEVAAPDRGVAWLQRQLVLEQGSDVREWHQELTASVRGATADGLLGQWFFVHKPPGSTTHPPGVRLRFRPTTSEHADELDRRLRAELADGRSPWTSGVYEPEHLLFGGSASMVHVHDMFWADSTFWSEVHGRERQVPTWLVAMAQQRDMLRSLQVLGWEDLGVFGWLRDHAHRRTTRTDASMVRACQAVRDMWGTSDLTAMLPASVVEPYACWRESFDASARAWSLDYLCSEDAVIGARQFAATLIVFSWNRALVNTRYQCIIASALSDVAARFGATG